MTISRKACLYLGNKCLYLGNLTLDKYLDIAVRRARCTKNIQMAVNEKKKILGKNLYMIINHASCDSFPNKPKLQVLSSKYYCFIVLSGSKDGWLAHR